ncbi:MAG: GNAT family protein [Cyanobacteria bacterium P01_G01_bin.38]
MQFCLASNDHRAIFSQWNQASRLEERTCRPITNGKRAEPDGHVVTLAFFEEDRHDIEPVGRFVYFDFNPRNRSAEFGYIVNPGHRGKGIGTKMVTLALDHLFSTTDLNKLYCQTAAFNTASIKLLEKLKFHKDGILREHHELDGQLWNDIIYSILRREWTGKDRAAQ